MIHYMENDVCIKERKKVTGKSSWGIIVRPLLLSLFMFIYVHAFVARFGDQGAMMLSPPSTVI